MPQSIEDAYFLHVTLGQQLRQLQEDRANGVGITSSPARAIAGAPGEYGDTVTKLLEHASSKHLGEADYEIAIAELEKAVDVAARGTVRPWFALGSQLRDLIQPYYKEQAALLLAADDKIPDGVPDLQTAGRRGVSEAWIAAEKHHEAVRAVHKLVISWVEHKILPGVKEFGENNMYDPSMLFYKDPYAARKAAGSLGGWHGEALRLREGGAQINTYDEAVNIMRPTLAEYHELNVNQIAWQAGQRYSKTR